MSDARDDDFENLDELDDLDDLDDERLLEEEETDLDRSRAEYTGVDLGDEFQPVDEVELAEEGMLLDDPERLAGDVRTRADSLDPDDVGWELDDDS